MVVEPGPNKKSQQNQLTKSARKSASVTTHPGYDHLYVVLWNAKLMSYMVSQLFGVYTHVFVHQNNVLTMFCTR